MTSTPIIFIWELPSSVHALCHPFYQGRMKGKSINCPYIWRCQPCGADFVHVGIHSMHVVTLSIEKLKPNPIHHSMPATSIWVVLQWCVLAPGALIFFGTSREGAYLRLSAYSGQGAYFFFEKQPNVQNRNCNSNKFMVNVQLTWENFNLFQLP